MDFPVFHLDWLGNRMLIALTAIIHVLINHPLAVGAYPLLTLFEWWGYRRNDAEWDQLTRKIVFVVFIITTSLGALTGVGIWLTTSVVAPFAIGSLLRVFFWQWLTEWLVFVAEVVLIMCYYLTWGRMVEGRAKRLHIGIGGLLSVFSWLTMALIVAILGFMMSSGAWTTDQSFFSAVLNPLYVPQLAFRTAFSMTTSGLFVWFCICFLTAGRVELRARAVRLASGWSLFWLPFCAASAMWYWRAVPRAMKVNADVALLTQAFSKWHSTFLLIIALTVSLIAVYVLAGLFKPRLVPRFALLLPFFLAAWLLGHFERVREFIRKPYVIAGYMYSNGVRVSEMPVFQRDGILPYATYMSQRQVTSSNRWEAGRDVFMLTCSRCHTTNGVNAVSAKLTNMLGKQEWTEQRLTNFILGMHLTRTYMPPFPGSPAEAEALAGYLKSLQPGRSTQPLLAATPAQREDGSRD
jgi:mono/diheme cytochrome c family protein